MYILSAYDSGDTPIYTAEAFVAARALRRHTTAPIRLLTNAMPFVDRLSGRPDFPFTAVTPITGDEPPKAFKIRAIGGMDDTDCVFLDTDTIPLADIGRVFGMGPFDVAGALAPGRDRIDGIDAAIAGEWRQRIHLNSGVLFIRRGHAGRLAEAWLANYRKATARSGARAFDQPALHKALETLGADVFVLPPNYNFRVNFGGLLSGACFVLHTHYRHDLAALIRADLAPAAVDRFIDGAARINATTGLGLVAPAGNRSLMRADLSRRRWRRSVRDRVGDLFGRR